MSETKTPLVIGIPTHNRAERLQRAIQTALGQSIPCRVIVGDNGDDDTAEIACREHEDHPHFTYLRSPGKKIWHNWSWIARQAAEMGASYFMWLQDDDLITPRLARRIVRSFDHYKEANVYCARLSMAYDNMLGCAWVGNWGPKIPMDMLWGQPTTFSGKVLTPIAYFDSWCMAPAKAFRVNEAFLAMLDAVPDDCDMFTERLDIATIGLTGAAIGDPAMAGYWMMHGRNESQLTADTCNDQVVSAYRYLDGLMDLLPDWRNELLGWMSALGTADVVHASWKACYMHADKSPYCAQIVELLEDILIRSGITPDRTPAATGLKLPGDLATSAAVAVAGEGVAA